MYKIFIRPVLFLFSPEYVHHLVVTVLKYTYKIPLFRRLIGKIFYVDSELLHNDICGLKFKNRVGLAAGFDKNADFYNEFALFGFSSIEIGTVTPVAQPGNSKPRLFRLKKDNALINRMGFNNKGVQYVADKLNNKETRIIIGGNIGKNTLTPNHNAFKDYLFCFDALYDKVDYFVINVSCPNITGLEKLQDHDSLSEIINVIAESRLKKKTYKPVFLKISPDLSLLQIDETLDLCRTSGINGVIVSNTSTKRLNLNTDVSKLTKIGNGGLSGKPLTNRIKELVGYICNKCELPVIAVGGIMTADDAIELIKLGASMVQVYTGFIYEGPFLVKAINKRLIEYYKNLNNN